MSHHKRFFVPESSIEGPKVTLSGAVVHQVKNVLRISLGEHITLLDNSGWEYDVEITQLSADQLVGTVQGKSLANTEPRTKITIYQGLLRGQHFELVLQKATEVGVSVIVPTISGRCVIAHVGEATNNKVTRWERIVAEAAEQSRRGKIPTLRPAIMFPQACEQVRGLSFLPFEDEDSVSLRNVLREVGGGAKATGRSGWKDARPFSVNLFIGPEGGFSRDEIDLARSYGITPVTLGPRVLRAETAGIVAAALVLHELGDME